VLQQVVIYFLRYWANEAAISFGWGESKPQSLVVVAAVVVLLLLLLLLCVLLLLLLLCVLLVLHSTAWHSPAKRLSGSGSLIKAIPHRTKHRTNWSKGKGRVVYHHSACSVTATQLEGRPPLLTATPSPQLTAPNSQHAKPEARSQETGNQSAELPRRLVWVWEYKCPPKAEQAQCPPECPPPP
jgi:hypothetical protein